MFQLCLDRISTRFTKDVIGIKEFTLSYEAAHRYTLLVIRSYRHQDSETRLKRRTHL